MGVGVTDALERSRYEVSVDGALAGFAEYVRDGDVSDFTHTEIDDAFGGQGLGGKLARAALDEERAAGRHVIPHCPFIGGWIAKHPEYVDLVPDEHRDLLPTS